MTSYIYPERRLGIMYERTKNMTVKEIAAQIRKTIRQAAKDGIIPSEWKYSVRYRSASMSQAIDVTVEIPADIYDLEQAYWDEHNHPYRTFPEMLVGKYEPLARMLQTSELLNSIHRGYNYDGSDSMTDYYDVRFYGNVSFIREGRDW